MVTFKPVSALTLWLLCSVSISLVQAQLKQVVSADMEMVVSAHFLATEAGEKVLAAGGTAVDAMIAVQTVLSLVEPQASGIAGGAFVVYYDADAGEL